MLEEKRLKEKKLREKELEKKRKISKFINEVKKLLCELDSKSKIYLEKYNNDSITMKIFLEIYKDAIDVNSIYEFKKVVNKQYIRDIINKYLRIFKFKKYGLKNFFGKLWYYN